MTKQTPKNFIVLSDNDSTVPSDHGVRFYLACRSAGVQSELHVFKGGGHGYGLGTGIGPVSNWPALCKEWLETLHIFDVK